MKKAEKLGGGARANPHSFISFFLNAINSSSDRFNKIKYTGDDKILI